MASPELMTAIEEAGENHETLLLEPRHFFDQFIVGLAEKGADVFVVYDKAAMLAKMAETDESDEEEDYDPHTAAIEHFDFNMNQGGEGKPAFITMDPDADA